MLYFGMCWILLRGPRPSGPIFAILRDSFIIFSDMLQTDPKRSIFFLIEFHLRSIFYDFVVLRGNSISSYSFQYFCKIPFAEYSQSLGLQSDLSLFRILIYNLFFRPQTFFIFDIFFSKLKSMVKISQIEIQKSGTPSGSQNACEDFAKGILKKY